MSNPRVLALVVLWAVTVCAALLGGMRLGYSQARSMRVRPPEVTITQMEAWCRAQEKETP